MKINFDGQFREVLRVVNTPVAHASDGPKQFEKVLGEIEPKVSETAGNTVESGGVQSALQMEDSSVMARFNFSEPSLARPPIFDDTSGPASVKNPTHSVMPPQVLDARRVSRSVSAREMHTLIDSTGVSVGVDPALSLAVAKMESSFNPKAVSTDGHHSKGLFQLLDTTGKQLHSKLESKGAYDPFNPAQNAKLGVEYLRYLHEIFSKETDLPNSFRTVSAANSSSLEKLAVAAFNAGEGRVASAQARAKRAGHDPADYGNVEPYLPESTQQYVQRVLAFRNGFDGLEPDDDGRS